jgi:hypothetical protein
METEKYNILTGTYCGTTAFGGGGFIVWGCFSLNCKIDLYVIDGILRGQKYRDQILRSLVVPHFYGHPLASRPILMDGNARPHNTYSARLSATGGNRATTLVSHVTGYESDKACMGLSRTKSERTYPEVSKHSGIALVQGWQQYPQHRLRRLIHGIRRGFQELYRMRGGYTRY